MIIAGITAFQYYLRGTSTQSQQINYSTFNIKQIKAGDINQSLTNQVEVLLKSVVNIQKLKRLKQVQAFRSWREVPLLL